jgi:hypothetical protein
LFAGNMDTGSPLSRPATASGATRGTRLRRWQWSAAQQQQGDGIALTETDQVEAVEVGM